MVRPSLLPPSLPPLPFFPFSLPLPPFFLPLPPSLPPSHHPHTMSCVPIVGVSLSEPHTSVVYRSTCIDRPTDQLTPPSRLTCRLQHSSGSPPVMIIICLVYHNRYAHLCSLSPLTFLPPSLPPSHHPHTMSCVPTVGMPTSAAIVPCFQAFWKTEARTDWFDRFLLRDPV